MMSRSLPSSGPMSPSAGLDCRQPHLRPDHSGRGERDHPFSVIGSEPQDVSYRAADRVGIGDQNVIREVTIHRGSEGTGVTRIGSLTC
jgi:hypothetical protein